MLYAAITRKFFFFSAVSFFLFSVSFFSYSQNKEEQGSLFILKGNTKLLSGKAAEGVDMELKKDGKIITKVLSGKNGKYYIQMEASTTNPKSEYVLNISQIGTVPKTISINTYIPPLEFNLNPFVRYDFDLSIVMIETTVKDIVLERPSGKIKWDNTQHIFGFDQVYAKIVQKDEDKMKDENYLRELAAKKKKEDEDAAKKKADEDAKIKADADAKLKGDEEAKRIADQKSREEADRILQQNLEAMKQEMKKKRMQDSLDSLARLASNTKIEIQKFVKPVSPEDVDQNAFDGTGAYSINIAKKTLKAQQEKTNKEKAKNLSAKYETNNTLTSLLDMVDENDKKMKKQ
ncbi:MAG: hypothetical protein HY841_10860 [Bacteroidetes bacterium]|nr:hypothetical protein [Bacteroidota bacterium]